MIWLAHSRTQFRPHLPPKRTNFDWNLDLSNGINGRKNKKKVRGETDNFHWWSPFLIGFYFNFWHHFASSSNFWGWLSRSPNTCLSGHAANTQVCNHRVTRRTSVLCEHLNTVSASLPSGSTTPTPHDSQYFYAVQKGKHAPKPSPIYPHLLGFSSLSPCLSPDWDASKLCAVYPWFTNVESLAFASR